MVFYVQKTGHQRTFFHSFTHKVFLLPFKPNSILYSDDQQSCLGSKALLAEGIDFFMKKTPKNRGSANQRDFGLRTKWFQWKLSIISQQKQKIFHQHAWKTHLKFSVSVGRQVTCFKTIFNQSLLRLTSCCQTSGSRDYLTPEEPRVQKGTFPNNPLLSSHTLYLPLKRRGQKGRLCEGYKPSL